MSGGLVELVVDEAGWRRALPEFEDIAGRAAGLALDSAGLDPVGWTICILATNDAEIARLNGEFRGRAAPTNVLSWPAFELAPDAPGGLPELPKSPTPGLRHPLGDVAIALQTIRREADAAAIPLQDHVVHLILHGCLHLLGFDHRIDEDAETMERIEVAALQRIGIPDPYLRGDAGRQPPD